MSKKWFEITNKAEATSAEILLYGEVGGGFFGDSGFTAEAFATELAQVPLDREIKLRIHSPGGSVWDGLAIYTLIAERRKYVEAHVDGMALSAASFIAMAARKVVMPAHARMMVHDAQGLAIGDSRELRELADLLEKESDNIANIYATKTGRPKAVMRDLMRSTTWMNGDEAKGHGFVDEVTQVEVKDRASFNLSVFRFVPADLGGGQPPPVGNHNKTQQTVMETAETTVTAEAKTAEVPSPDKTRIEALEKQVRQERELRITARVQALAVDHDIDPKEWTPRAVADESLIGAIEKLPRRIIGAEPLNFSGRLENVGSPILNAYSALKPGKARSNFAVENFADLVAARRKFDPKNLNTIAAGLINDFLADGVITVFTNRLAMLNSFTRSFSPNPMAPRQSVDVPKANSGSVTGTNPVNFEVGDSDLGVVTVAMNQYSQCFHLDNNAINQGFQLQTLAEINALTLANKISDIVTALMTTANFGTGITIGLASAFDSADLAPILAAAKNYRQKILLLDGGHLAYLMPQNHDDFRLGEQGAYGFDGIYEQNRWTGATPGAGFVCSPDAIAVASALPIGLPQGEFLSVGTAQTLQGLTVQTCTWYSRATRFHWASYDVVFGAAAGDTTQGEVLLTT